MLSHREYEDFKNRITFILIEGFWSTAKFKQYHNYRYV